MGLLPDSVDPALFAPILILSLPAVYLTYRLFTRLTSSSSKPYNPSTGIGRGAPGFQTGVRRVAIPPALAARIRAGEDVSAEEVTAALEAEKERIAKEEEEEEEREKKKIPKGVDEDWLPAGTVGGGNGKAKRRKK
ncbi:hypothetical protein JCM1841_003059 [Sporobolomyces salmonicolor]